MRNLLYTLIIFIVASCSAPKLLEQGLKKINKAIEKDPSLKLPNDTVVVTHSTVKIDTFDNLIIKTVTNTVIQTVNDCNYDGLIEKSARELRFERRNAKDSLEHLEKMYKLETNRLKDSLTFQKKLNRELTKRLDDQTNADVKIAKEETKKEKGGWFQRQMGKIWWLLLLIGLIGGFILGSDVFNIPNPFKRKDDDK